MADVDDRKLAREVAAYGEAAAVLKLVRSKCKKGEHAFSTKFCGHAWFSHELADHLGLRSKKNPQLTRTNCFQESCFFCGKTVRVLKVRGQEYRFEI